MSVQVGPPNAVVYSVIVPVCDEEEVLPRLHERLSQVLDSLDGSSEIVFVNDGSRDRTPEIIASLHARDPRVKLVDFARNHGKEIALTAGLDHAHGRAVIPMDVDLQDPPDVIARMVAQWRAGYDMVLARRSDRSEDGFLKRLTANGFYQVMNQVSDVKLPDNVGDFRLMDQRVVAVLRQYRERTRFMKGIFASLGFRQTVVEYARPQRAAGTTKFRAWKLWTLALEGIVSFSSAPLKIWTYIGLAGAAFALFFMIYIVLTTLLFGNTVPGYASLISFVLLFNSLTLIGLGVIGEYIARIFYEVKGRPLYILRGTLGIDQK